MKPQHFAALAGALALAVLVLLFTGRPVVGPGQAAPSPRMVTVFGEGEVRAKPDQVILTFDVSSWTQGASAAEAEALNLASVGRLRSAVESAGADASLIDAARPVITPLTRQDYAGKTYLTGYHAASTVVVTLTNLQRADAVTAAALGNGATGLTSAVYGLKDPTETRQRALQAAVASARARAAAIVEGQSRSLGSLVELEMLTDEGPASGTVSTANSLVYRVRIRASYEY